MPLAAALLLANTVAVAAQTPEPRWLTALYFEDAVGNRDTVEIGYDPRVDAGFDYPATELGQVVDRNPFDPVFEVRVKHGIDHSTAFPPSDEWYHRLISQAWQPHPDRDCFRETVGAVFAVRAKYQPITVRWDPSAFTSNYCHIGAVIVQHDWIARYEGTHGPFWWQGYPEYLDSTRCLALDSTWTTTLTYGDGQWDPSRAVDHAVVPGRNGSLDTLFTMRVYVVQERSIISPCVVTYVSAPDFGGPPALRVNLQPNPTSGLVDFHDGGWREYYVFDVLGREVLRGAGTGLDVTTLTAGLYVVVGRGWRASLVVQE